jgi:hypothetical protein
MVDGVNLRLSLILIRSLFWLCFYFVSRRYVYGAITRVFGYVQLRHFILELLILSMESARSMK